MRRRLREDWQLPFPMLIVWVSLSVVLSLGAYYGGLSTLRITHAEVRVPIRLHYDAHNTVHFRPSPQKTVMVDVARDRIRVAGKPVPLHAIGPRLRSTQSQVDGQFEVKVNIGNDATAQDVIQLFDALARYGFVAQ